MIRICPPTLAAFALLLSPPVLAEGPTLTEEIEIGGDLPLVYQPVSDGEWALGATYKAHVNGEGFTFIPMLGAEAPANAPIHFRLSAARVGGTALELGEEALSRRHGDRWFLDRGMVEVRYDLAKESVEQSFLVNTAGLAGALELHINVETELAVRPADRGGFTFEGPFGGATYGRAFAVDAKGDRSDVFAHFDGQVITLTVPADVVARSGGQVLVDPLLQSYWVGEFIGDERRSDIAYEALSNSYLTVFERTFSGGDGDILMKQNAPDGTELALFAVDISGDTWSAPRAATLAGDRTVLVTAVTVSGANVAIQGRALDVPSGILAAPFVIADTGVSTTTSYDLGGSSSFNAGRHFAVVWAHDFGATGAQVRTRRVRADGGLEPISAFDTTFNGARGPVAISKSTGNTLQADLWNVAYAAEDFASGTMSIRGLQLAPDGSLGSGPASLRSSLPYDILRLDVSDALQLSGTEPTYIVAYEDTSPVQRSIQVLVCEESTRINGFNLRSREHRGGAFAQVEPQVATTASDFLVTYLRSEGSQHIPVLTALDLIAGVEMGISEQTLALGAPLDISITRRGGVAIASRFSGGSLSSRWSATSWSRFDANTGRGSIRAAGHTATNDRACGVQYCESTVNSTGERGFLTLYGDQTATGVKRAVATRLPVSSFGFLSSGTTLGNVPGAGGSAGVLCLGGTTGRYINQIQSSGLQGRIETVVDPTAIPSGGSLIPAMAGQFWTFQFWHRDLVGGVQVSNFTNGVLLFVQ